MNPAGEETIVVGADRSSQAENAQLQPHSASDSVATVESDGLPSQFAADEYQEGLQSKELEQDRMKRSLELVGMKQMIEQMTVDQEKLRKEIAKLTAQNESYQNEIRSLNEKLNSVMATKKKEDDPNDDLRKYKDLPIMKMSSRCWSRAAWFRIYEDVMATNDRHLLKYCLLYYLSDDFQSKSFMEYFEKRNYEELKLMFLTANEF